MKDYRLSEVIDICNHNKTCDNCPFYYAVASRCGFACRPDWWRYHFFVKEEDSNKEQGEESKTSKS